MAVTVIPFLKFLEGQLNGAHPVDWNSDTIKVTLHAAAAAPVRDTDEFYSDVSDEHSTSGGYTAGGATLAGCAVTPDAAGDFVALVATDQSWTAAAGGFSAATRYAVIRKDTGVAGTSPLIAYVDLGADQDPDGVVFTLDFPAAAAGGILKFQA